MERTGLKAKLTKAKDTHENRTKPVTLENTKAFADFMQTEVISALYFLILLRFHR